MFIPYTSFIHPQFDNSNCLTHSTCYAKAVHRANDLGGKATINRGKRGWFLFPDSKQKEVLDFVARLKSIKSPEQFRHEYENRITS